MPTIICQFLIRENTSPVKRKSLWAIPSVFSALTSNKPFMFSVIDLLNPDAAHMPSWLLFVNNASS